EFYPAVASDRVTLAASALEAVDGRVLTATDGSTHEVDALVLATGFASTRQPYADLVSGEGGATLAAHWSEGMTSFASTVVSGFPNMFVLNGPNASLGHNSSVLMIEEQAAYAVRALATRAERARGGLRVTPAAEEGYTAEIADAAASTPWIGGGCRNWYVDERSGRLTLLWPGTVGAFRARLARADGSEFEPSRTPHGTETTGAPAEGAPRGAS
ncbi:MAG: 4-hydroxyacetophenone monooxygenase, partial [Microbacterium sp.]